MSRYFLECAYEGTRYHGWQVQPNGITVQQVLEEKLEQLLQRPVPITGSGRTDTGVHARQQYAHFDYEGLEEKFSLSEMAYKLDRMLPEDIAIRSIRKVRPDAHARFDAMRRTYQYFIHCNKDPFLQTTSCQVHGELSLPAMQEAAALLLEYNDFASFCKSQAGSKTTICRVEQAVWEPLGATRWVFTITADRFLRNMVRAIVGTLMEAGKGKMSIAEFRTVIETHDRRAAGNSAPAQGLFLTRVEYPETIFANGE